MTKELREKIQKAAAGKGEIMIVETDVKACEVAAFRIPTSAEWTRFKIAQKGESEDAAKSSKPLVICCCVYPDDAEFEAALDARPGLVDTFVNELVGHAGAGRAKKVETL